MPAKKNKTARAKSKTATAARPKGKAKRRMPKFFRIDEEMKSLCAMLEKEVAAWPGVTKKPMFGHQALFRKGAIFAALPKTRAIRSPRSVMLKFAEVTPAISAAASKDSRIGRNAMRSPGWMLFELDESSATRDALAWINRAYDSAGQ